MLGENAGPLRAAHTHTDRQRQLSQSSKSGSDSPDPTPHRQQTGKTCLSHQEGNCRWKESDCGGKSRESLLNASGEHGQALEERSPLEQAAGGRPGHRTPGERDVTAGDTTFPSPEAAPLRFHAGAAGDSASSGQRLLRCQQLYGARPPPRPGRRTAAARRLGCAPPERGQGRGRGGPPPGAGGRVSPLPAGTFTRRAAAVAQLTPRLSPAPGAALAAATASRGRADRQKDGRRGRAPPLTPGSGKGRRLRPRGPVSAPLFL